VLLKRFLFWQQCLKVTELNNCLFYTSLSSDFSQLLFMKISIITVSYNSENTILDTLDSVANQVYADIEHIVIDGASTDLTLTFIRSHGNKNIKIISEKDFGIYDAMNKGLASSTADIIGFLNSDDLYVNSQVLTRIAEVFNNDPSVEACFGDLLYVSQDKLNILRYWRSSSFEKGSFARGWSPAHPTFFIRRSALERLGLFDLSYRLASDTEFMMRYLERGGVKSIYIPHVLVRMRVGGATNKSWGNIFIQNQEIFRALKSNGIPYSPFTFIIYKLFSRLKQRFNGYRLRKAS
jgi:glycosyltransferase involved in cell wall biosynthesis